MFIFPVYKDGDSNAGPTGGTSTITFRWDGSKFIYDKVTTSQDMSTWQTFTHAVTNSNVQISFQYPSDWTVGTFKNDSDQFTIQPSSTFQAESFQKCYSARDWK